MVFPIIIFFKNVKEKISKQQKICRVKYTEPAGDTCQMEVLFFTNRNNSVQVRVQQIRTNTVSIISMMY